ncbi:MAG: hypothetical protein AAF725_27455, partial [Acidobacteriota bacterium]
MGKNVSRFLGLATLAGLVLTPSALLAAPLADVGVAPAGLQIDPIVSVDGLQLTVTGPNDFYFRQVFDSGEPIFVPFVAGLDDGTYAYELVSLAAPRSRGADGARAETFSQSGSFSLEAGLGVDSALAERRPQKDIVQNDDLIVTFSLCTGNDCVNGESFGFDT